MGFEFSSYHFALVAIGACILLSYWLPRFFREQEPAASALILTSGAAVFGLVPAMPLPLSPLESSEFWEVTSELAVISALFGAGLRIDTALDFSRLVPTLRLLVIAMPVTILAVAVAGWGIAGFSLAGALVLGAILAPTDPVLAGDLQVGPPQEGREHPVRYTLTTEAGLNDGLAFPFLYLGALVAAEGLVPGSWGLRWLLWDVGYRIVVGVAGGMAVGWLIGRLVFVFPANNRLADKGAGVIAIAAVLFCYGATELVEGYGFISAFVAGTMIRRIESDHAFHRKLHDFSEAAEHVLAALLLFLLGGVLPQLLARLTLPLAVISLLLIFVIRPVAGWTSLLGTSATGGNRGLISFYGVRGIGSIYYVAYASTHLDLPEEDQLWVVTAFCILSSTLVHGLTAGVVDRWLSVREEQVPDPEAAGRGPTGEERNEPSQGR